MKQFLLVSIFLFLPGVSLANNQKQQLYHYLSGHYPASMFEKANIEIHWPSVISGFLHENGPSLWVSIFENMNTDIDTEINNNTDDMGSERQISSSHWVYNEKTPFSFQYTTRSDFPYIHILSDINIAEASDHNIPENNTQLTLSENHPTFSVDDNSHLFLSGTIPLNHPEHPDWSHLFIDPHQDDEFAATIRNLKDFDKTGYYVPVRLIRLNGNTSDDYIIRLVEVKTPGGNYALGGSLFSMASGSHTTSFLVAYRVPSSTDNDK